jgi:hypothetical protein
LSLPCAEMISMTLLLIDCLPMDLEKPPKPAPRLSSGRRALQIHKP